MYVERSQVAAAADPDPFAEVACCPSARRGIMAAPTARLNGMASTDPADYDLFISHARTDDEPAADGDPRGWVTAVRDFLVADHGRHSADPFRVFLDPGDVRDEADWRDRILGPLRRSRMLVVCLSPSYLASPRCRWEWDEFHARRGGEPAGPKPFTTVYLHKVGQTDPRDGERLRAVFAKYCADLRPWVPAGPAAIRDEPVRARLEVLGQIVWELLDRPVAGPVNAIDAAGLEALLAALPPAARTLLAFAAQLPPDGIPWPWVKKLTLRHHPELKEWKPARPDPWRALRRRVQGQRLLTGSATDPLARMPRRVAVHLRGGAAGESGAELRTFVADRCDLLDQSPTAPAAWELDALLVAIPHLLAAQPDERLASRRRNLAAACLQWGGAALAAGDLAAARDHYRRAQVLLKRLADEQPSAARRWGLSVAHNKLGGVAVAAGDLVAARRLFERAVILRESLAGDDPASAVKARGLSSTLFRLGSVALAAGDWAAALDYYRRCQEIVERLADDDPAAAPLRKLAVGYEKLGGAAAATNPARARRPFELSLALRQRLAAQDPSPATLRDLSVGHEKLGDVAATTGDPVTARRQFELALALRERLAQEGPPDADRQRDLAVSYFKLATLADRQRAPEAAGWWRQFVAAFDRLRAAGVPVSAADARVLESARAKLAGETPVRPAGGRGRTKRDPAESSQGKNQRRL